MRRAAPCQAGGVSLPSCRWPLWEARARAPRSCSWAPRSASTSWETLASAFASAAFAASSSALRAALSVSEACSASAAPARAAADTPSATSNASPAAAILRESKAAISPREPFSLRAASSSPCSRRNSSAISAARPCSELFGLSPSNASGCPIICCPSTAQASLGGASGCAVQASSAASEALGSATPELSCLPCSSASPLNCLSRSSTSAICRFASDSLTSSSSRRPSSSAFR
mmetsp:Transcript_15952/g.37807  ORF Transcript_15952/g.37807 Transcript_15952/m.37807 type:complete len:233 (-) Transcript_15952:1986-2684(-)